MTDAVNRVIEHILTVVAFRAVKIRKKHPCKPKGLSTISRVNDFTADVSVIITLLCLIVVRMKREITRNSCFVF